MGNENHVEKVEKLLMVKAMEFICRHINNEEVLEGWLMNGVADGDIEYGDFSIDNFDEDEAVYYIEDDQNFAELMGCFLRRMSAAKKDGGLYCGNIVSSEG